MAEGEAELLAPKEGGRGCQVPPGPEADRAWQERAAGMPAARGRGAADSSEAEAAKGRWEVRTRRGSSLAGRGAGALARRVAGRPGWTLRVGTDVQWGGADGVISWAQ